MEEVEVTGPSIWAYLVGLIVQGYQRRGMSEEVGSWIYAKLAVDPMAEEWAQLQGA